MQTRIRSLCLWPVPILFCRGVRDEEKTPILNFCKVMGIADILESSNPGVLIQNREDWDKVFNLCKVCQLDNQWWDNTYCAMYWYEKKNKLKFPMLFPFDMYD